MNTPKWRFTEACRDTGEAGSHLAPNSARLLLSRRNIRADDEQAEGEGCGFHTKGKISAEMRLYQRAQASIEMNG